MRTRTASSAFLLLAWAVAGAGGCASGLLAPQDLRTAEFTETTQVRRGTAFHRSLRWMDKNLTSAPGHYREQDPQAGTLKLEAATVCNVFRKPSDLKDYYLAFRLEFQANPKSIGFWFSDLRMERPAGVLVQEPEGQLGSAENVAAAQQCIKKMVASLAKAVESDSLAW